MKALFPFALLLLSAVVTPAALAQEVDGQISGVVVNASGQPLAGQRIELRRPTSEGPGQLVAITDANGQFVYQRLHPGRYEVELRVEGRVVATSGPIELSEGAMRVSGVTLARPAPPPAPPPERPRVSADRLLGAQAVMGSFEALQAILEPGYEVIVRDEAGRETRGRVSSMSRDQLVIAVCRRWSPCRRTWRFWLRPYSEERAFAEDSVTRIKTVDSTWNRAMSTILRQPGAAIYCSDSTVRMSAVD